MLAPTFFMCFMSKQMYHRFANRRRASICFFDLCFESNCSSITFLENRIQLRAFSIIDIIDIQKYVIDGHTCIPCAFMPRFSTNKSTASASSNIFPAAQPFESTGRTVTILATELGFTFLSDVH